MWPEESPPGNETDEQTTKQLVSKELLNSIEIINNFIEDFTKFTEYKCPNFQTKTKILTKVSKLNIEMIQQRNLNWGAFKKLNTQTQM